MSDCKCIPVNVCIDENNLPSGGSSQFTGLPILSVIPTLSSVPPPGFVFINKPSGLVERTAYPAVWAELQKINNAAILVDEDIYLAEIAKFGFCAKFSRGDGLDTFRFPQISGSWPGWANFAKSSLQAGTAMNDQVQGFNFGALTELGGNQRAMGVYNNRTGSSNTVGLSTLSTMAPGYSNAPHTGGASYPTYVEDQYGNGEPRIGDHTRPKTTLLNAAMKVADDYTNSSEANMAAMADGYAHKLDISTYQTNNTFSDEERFTGRYWTDGRPIYQKIINAGNMPNSTCKKVPHHIKNVNKFINYDVIMTASDGAILSGSNIYSTFAVGKTELWLEDKYDRSTHSCTFIIDYTKAT